MRLVRCDGLPQRIVRRYNKNMVLIEQFSESGNKVMKVEGWEESHKDVYSARNSLASAIKRTRRNHIKCATVDGCLYLLNTLLDPSYT